KTVFLHRRDACRVARLGDLAELGGVDLLLARFDLRLLLLRGEDVRPVDRKRDQPENHDAQDGVERSFGLSCHDLSLSQWLAERKGGTSLSAAKGVLAGRGRGRFTTPFQGVPPQQYPYPRNVVFGRAS